MSVWSKGNGRTGLWHLLKNLLIKSEALLSPNRNSCLACGGTYTRMGELPLCKACMEIIPWILSIQCDQCGRPESCPDCIRRKEQHFVQNRSAVSYNPQMKEWLASFKYRGREKLRKLLGVMLLHAYHLHHRETSSLQVAATCKELLTYVPLSKKRLLERGFNQAQQLAEELGGLTGIPVIPLLERVRHTDKQSFKTRGDRLEDLQGVFALIPSASEALQKMTAQSTIRLYIIDDVYTTGSTLDECAKVIKLELNLNVYGISWAR